jgi:hypothetical protein
LKPVIIEVPPATTIDPYRVLRTSISQLRIAFTTNSWTPGHSKPILSGENNISGALNFSEPN